MFLNLLEGLILAKLSWQDIKRLEVSDTLLSLGILLGGLEVYLGLGWDKILLYRLFGALVAFFFFWGISVLSRGKAMGLGDAKLSFWMGLRYPYLYLLEYFTWVFMLGSLTGLFFVITGKKKLKSSIALVPFFFLAFIIEESAPGLLLSFYSKLYAF